MSAGNFSVPEGQKVPPHWNVNSWEEKARENPLYAVMTTPDLIDADPENFSEEHLAPFFAKGRRVFDEHLKPCLDGAELPMEEAFIVDYGCGMGRVLRAMIEDGYACSGIDISTTMLRHCRRLVPQARSLHALDEQGRCDLPDAVATTVFSFAVVKHISSLTSYVRAVSEMCRLLKSKGTLALNVNCQDFVSGDLSRPERTENHETYSLHFQPGATKPYKRREYTSWSGVYIGIEKLRELLAAGGVEVLEVYHHTLKKPQGIWVIGRKKG